MTTPPAAGRGRPPGARNKRTVEFMATLEREGFDPAMALIECYREARKTYDNYGTIYDAICDANTQKGQHFAPPEDRADKYLKIAADIAKDLASYAYPKLKSIEKKDDNHLKDMSPTQRLEAMRHAVQMLELQIKKDNGSTGD